MLHVIATPESTISDIERAFSLNWITKKGAKNELIQKIKNMLRIEKRIVRVEERMKDGKRKEKLIERLETRVDKVLARALLRELKLYNRKILNEQAYNLLKEDIEWLIANY